MNHNDIQGRTYVKEVLVAGLAYYFLDGYQEWSRPNLEKIVLPRDYKTLVTETEFLEILKELEVVGMIKLYYTEGFFLEVIQNPLEIVKDALKVKDMRGMISAGISRWFHEGMKNWSRKDIEGQISPRGNKNSLDDPKIVQILKDLEAGGFIRLHYTDNKYFEVLRDPLD